MNLETKRLLLRNFREEDWQQVYAYLSDEEVMKYIEPAFVQEKTIDFLESYALCSNPSIFALVEKKSQAVVGHIIYRIHQPVNQAELGWILARSAWGKGYAYEISRELIRFAFEQSQADSVFIDTVAENYQAQKLIRKLGFIKDAKEQGRFLRASVVNVEKNTVRQTNP